MLRVFRGRAPVSKLYLDETPTGEEEEANVFSSPLETPADLNALILHERHQNMGERIIYSDRAFLITGGWVVFLMVVTLLQFVSQWEAGLSDAQFVAVVTTTTASTFGFWYLVGRYLHKVRPEDEEAPRSEKPPPENDNNA